MRGVELSKFNGVSCFKKVYLFSETAQFKCFGSGHINESFLPSNIRAFTPRVLGTRKTAATEETYLSILPGNRLPGHLMNQRQVRVAGERLRNIHNIRGKWFGSLDGRYRFNNWKDAWGRRWEVMLKLVRSARSDLADDLENWGKQLLPEIDSQWEPCLVHGDYGPANLLWPSEKCAPWVLDWEHARYGHPAEDWAKLLVSQRFPEPNGFGEAQGSIPVAILEGWLSTGPFLSWSVELTALLCAYYLGSLGVFLDSEPSPRLDWLSHILQEKGDSGINHIACLVPDVLGWEGQMG